MRNDVDAGLVDLPRLLGVFGVEFLVHGVVYPEVDVTTPKLLSPLIRRHVGDGAFESVLHGFPIVFGLRQSD